MRSPHRARPRESPRARAAAALLLSVALNAGLLLALAASGALRLPDARGPAAVALARLSAAEWEAHRRVAGASAGAAPVPAARSPTPVAAPRAPDPAGTLVRAAPAPDPRRPERARFLAERDGRVERETRFRGPRQPSAALAPRPLPGPPGAQGLAPGEEGNADEASPGRPGTPGDAEERIAAARRILAAAAADVDAAPTPAAAPGRAGGPGDGGAALRGRFDPRLLPVADGAAALGGGAPGGEPLPGVADGDATLVNTRAFRFAAFYRRVHDAIAGEWRPNRAWDARDPQDRLLGRTTRQVQLDIVLDREGSLREVRLLRGSGLDFFDAECLRAVRAAAPFPNPPRALVGSDGLVALRGWRLVFEWGPEGILGSWLPGR